MDFSSEHSLNIFFKLQLIKLKYLDAVVLDTID